MSALHIADTSLFVAIGQPSNSRYQAVRRFARRNDITFVLPERVYEELTVDDPDIEAPPDAAVTVLVELIEDTAVILSPQQRDHCFRYSSGRGCIQCKVRTHGELHGNESGPLYTNV